MIKEKFRKLIWRRPLLFVLLFFSGGISLGYYFTLPSFTSFLILSLSLVLLIIILFFPSSNQLNRIAPRLLLCFLVLFTAGFLFINWQELKYQSKFSTVRFNDGNQHTVLGEIVVSLNSLQGNKLYLKPYNIDGWPVKYGLVQLDKRFIPRKLQAGDIIRAGIVLKTPHYQLNPGGFSNYRYLKKRGIYSLGYLAGDFKKLAYRKNYLNYLLIQLKARLLTILETTIDNPDQQFIKALLLGERDHLPEEWKNNFSQAGVNHLLAISGLHVAFILMIFLSLLQTFKGMPFIQNLIISLLLLLYMMLTGLRPSIVRAGMLALAYCWAPVFKREGDIYNLLGLTALINLLINPYQLFNPGFQLSYLVLLMIINWYWIFNQFVPAPLAVSVAAQLGSIPLTAYYFNIIAPIGVLTNLWAIPLTGLIVALSIIGLLLGLINPIFCWLLNRPVYLLVRLMLRGVELMSALPFAFFEVASPAVLNCLIIYLFLLLFPFLYRRRFIPVNIEKRKRYLRHFSLVLLLFVLINIIIPIFNQQLEVVFLAVGQGDSVFIHLPSGENVLVDGGGMAGYDCNQGKRSILPFLRKRGIKKLDMVFITHFDTDHALGITELLKDDRVSLLIFPSGFERNSLSATIIKLAEEREVKLITVSAGDRFRIKEAVIQVLNPDFDPAQNVSRNENSIVLRLTYRYFSMLLTGDLESEGEKRLLAKGLNLSSYILKLGHHGSNSSSSLPFLDRISPREGIISVGDNNYGHPSAAVVERAEELGIRIWRTDRQGAIMINSNGFQYSISGFRKSSNERNKSRSF